MEDKILFYKKIQFVSGLYALLIAIDFCEKYEYYQEAYYIKSAIESNNKQLNLNCETHMSKSDYKSLDNNKKNHYISEAKILVERLTKTL